MMAGSHFSCAEHTQGQQSAPREQRRGHAGAPGCSYRPVLGWPASAGDDRVSALLYPTIARPERTRRARKRKSRARAHASGASHGRPVHREQRRLRSTGDQRRRGGRRDPCYARRCVHQLLQRRCMLATEVVCARLKRGRNPRGELAQNARCAGRLDGRLSILRALGRKGVAVGAGGGGAGGGKAHRRRHRAQRLRRAGRRVHDAQCPRQRVSVFSGEAGGDLLQGGGEAPGGHGGRSGHRPFSRARSLSRLAVWSAHMCRGGQGSGGRLCFRGSACGQHGLHGRAAARSRLCAGHGLPYWAPASAYFLSRISLYSSWLSHS